MTKLLCVDFDGTLSNEKIASLIKRISDYLKKMNNTNVKIGIVTSRSIYDDFKTAGQFYDEISDVLQRNNLKLDFICTRFCLHQIDPVDYETLNIPEAINNAKKIPVFGEVVSDYLAYRAANMDEIALINRSDYKESHRFISALRTKVEDNIQFELQLHAEHIKGKISGDSTPKVQQIETVIASYGLEIEETEVLLLDDDPKHIRAIQSYNNINWNSVHFIGFISEVKTQLLNFLGIEQPVCTSASSSDKPKDKVFLKRLSHLFSKDVKTEVRVVPEEENGFGL